MQPTPPPTSSCIKTLGAAAFEEEYAVGAPAAKFDPELLLLEAELPPAAVAAAADPLTDCFTLVLADAEVKEEEEPCPQTFLFFENA
jgi:hypothetical protein